MHFYMENFWRVFNRHQDCRPKASPWGRMRAGELVESEQGRSSEHCVSQETCWRWCNSFSDPLDPFSVPWCYYGDRWLRRQGGDVFSIVFLYIFFKRYFNDSLSNEYVYWTFRQLAQICAGNFLECLNLALNHFDQHHLDRLLRVSGQALQGANEGLGKSPNLQFQFMFFQSTLQPMIHILFSDWYLKDQLSFSCSTEACTTGGGHHDCWLRFDPNQKQGALPFDQSAMHLDQLASSAVVSSLDGMQIIVWPFGGGTMLDCAVSPGCLSKM